MKRVYFLALLLLLFSCSFVFAAGKQAEAAAEKTVTIDFWSTLSQPERVEVMEELIAKFEQETPNIKVNLVVTGWGDYLNKIIAAISANNAPALGTIGQGAPQTLSGTGGIVTLEDVVAELGGEDQFTGTSLSVLSSLNGKIWSLPIYVTPHGLWYRESWFKEKGLAVPQDWSEFENVCAKVTDPAINRYSYSVPFNIHGGKPIWAWLLTNGQTIFDRNGNFTFDRENTVETFAYLANIIKKYAPSGAASYDQAEVQLLYAKGVFAFYYETPNILSIVQKENPAIANDVKYMLVPKKVRRGAGTGWVGLAVFDTPQVKEAKQFTRFFFKDENLLKFTLAFPYLHFPAYKPVLAMKEYEEQMPDILKPVLKIAPEALENGAGIAQLYQPVEVSGEIEASLVLPNTLNQIVTGAMTPEAAVKKGTETIKNMLRK